MKPHNCLQNIPGKQSGVVLIISLILLAVLMLIVSTGLQVTTMEEKMAGNVRDTDLAFQTAESALRVAEVSLNPPATYPTFSATGTNGYYTKDTTIDLSQTVITSNSFWTTQNKKVSTVNNLGNGIPAPVYIIQEMGCKAYDNGDGSKVTCPGSFPSNTFKITVKATGRSPNTVVILQSVYCPTNCGV